MFEGMGFDQSLEFDTGDLGPCGGVQVGHLCVHSCIHTYMHAFTSRWRSIPGSRALWGRVSWSFVCMCMCKSRALWGRVSWSFVCMCMCQSRVLWGRAGWLCMRMSVCLHMNLR